ncbi:hypothetical protein EON63_07410 [archaeon]|nr:MAG: hypothetical protein EON63_07410 [archaeon]
MRSQLAPIVRPTETDPSQLFNPDYTQSILNPPAPAADKDGDDNLLAEYFDSSNRILRMLSQDQGDDSAMEGVLRSNSELFAEASQQTYHSSMAQDDELVDAFIEERYKVARMKKQKTQKQQPSESPRHREGGDDQEGEKGEEGEDENFKWQHADSQDDHSVGNQSLSSLGDQSAAVYDLILPTASSAIPPPKTRSNTINTITTLPSLNSSSLPKELEYQAANARNDTLSPSNSFASPVDETGLVDAEGMPILSGQHDIPVNPW